jgi:hypothetical protein
MSKYFVRHSLALVLLAGSALPCLAQLPAFYSTTAGAVWVVKDESSSLAAWRGLGLDPVHDDAVVIDGQPNAGARFASGRMGRFAVNLLQPAPGDSVYAAFLRRRGDGVFSILHAVPDRAALDHEAARLGALGVKVLGRLKAVDAEYTFFDTEPQGKYVLGLVYRPAALPAAAETADAAPARISHLGFVARDAAPVSAYWQRLGFPAIPLSDAGPREDSRYRGKPLWFSFRVGWQGHARPGFEWIVPPLDPPNCYADFLNLHGEGVHHIGIPVDDLDQAVAHYVELGYPVAQSGAWGTVGKPHSGRYAYMGTEALGGVSVELIHAIP